MQSALFSLCGCLLVIGAVAQSGCSSEGARHHDAHAEAAMEGDEAEEADDAIAFFAAPKSVQEAYRKVAGSIEPSRVLREEDDEIVEFEIEYQSEGHACSLRTTAEGDVLELEQSVDSAGVSRLVLDALKHRFPNAKIDVAERVHEYHYEFKIVVDGKTHDVSIDPNGDIDDEQSSD